VKLRHQHAGVQRLLDEAEGAVFHRLDRDRDAAAADDDDCASGFMFLSSRSVKASTSETSDPSG
jgi:hypothetical protein